MSTAVKFRCFQVNIKVILTDHLNDEVPHECID